MPGNMLTNISGAFIFSGLKCSGREHTHLGELAHSGLRDAVTAPEGITLAFSALAHPAKTNIINIDVFLIILSALLVFRVR